MNFKLEMSIKEFQYIMSAFLACKYDISFGYKTIWIQDEMIAILGEKTSTLFFNWKEYEEDKTEIELNRKNNL